LLTSTNTGCAEEIVCGSAIGGDFKGVSDLVERRSATGGFSGSGPKGDFKFLKAALGAVMFIYRDESCRNHNKILTVVGIAILDGSGRLLPSGFYNAARDSDIEISGLGS
jgi:hypothetical protein